MTEVALNTTASPELRLRLALTGEGTVALHVFVVMPFGRKQGIDFDAIYEGLIKPALDGEGFEVFRADDEITAGNIRTDMFQELLMADLVVADLSIDNPNVWYELGVRHALRARGMIQIASSARERMPFDVYTDRKLRYHVLDGVPDPSFLAEDRLKLAAMARETMASWHGKKISPVFYHLEFLQEPHWKELKVGDAQEFWDKLDDWSDRIEVARKENRPGDILILAEEVPVQALAVDAYRTAGRALHRLGRVQFALEQFERALALAPDDLESLQQKGVLLGRSGSMAEKVVWLQDLAERFPDNPETLSLLGRVRKEAWIEAWRLPGAPPEQMQSEAASWDGLLQDAIEPYERAFLRDNRHFYSGINALTLFHLLRHLSGTVDEAKLRTLEGAVRWSILSALARETPDRRDYWARVTLGEVEVLTSETPVMLRAYKNAVIVAENDWFALDSSRQQLLLLRDLQFRVPQVEAALAIFDQTLAKLEEPWQPRRVFLFSGHMIDAPDRAESRFPPGKEPIAAAAIARELEQLDAGPDDLALCGGACGGDILFAEACLQRGIRLTVRISYDIPEFIQRSVSFAGEGWRDRFYAMKDNPLTTLLIMPEELGPNPDRANPYVRSNLWQLYNALAWGPEKVHFICLWNRQGGDGPGGTQHLHDEVNKRTGQVHVLDTNVLFKEGVTP